MIFSNPAAAKTLNATFECAWEELRPAPRMRIDFGDGHVLDRTVNGNVATLFLTPEGGVFDVLPGIVDAAAYEDYAVNANERFRALTRRGAMGMSDLSLHLLQRSTYISRPSPLSPLAESTVLIGSLDSSFAILKGGVESPLRQAASFEPLIVVEEDTLSGPPSTAPRAARVSSHDAVVALVKGVLERPVKAVVKQAMTPADEVNLARDTRNVRTRLLPAALGILAQNPLCAPEMLTVPLFKDVLHVDLEDPFLGLAPDVLGGRLGRFGPSGPDGLAPPRAAFDQR